MRGLIYGGPGKAVLRILFATVFRIRPFASHISHPTLRIRYFHISDHNHCIHDTKECMSQNFYQVIQMKDEFTENVHTNRHGIVIH